MPQRRGLPPLCTRACHRHGEATAEDRRAHHLFRNRQRDPSARDERNGSGSTRPRLARPAGRGLAQPGTWLRGTGQPGSGAALRRLEGIEVACGRYPATCGATSRPYLQSWPWHPAGNARREREEPGSFCAGTFGAASGIRLPGNGCRKPSMKRIAIVGGGISGLAAAFALEEHRRNGAVLEYVLYESSAHLGGVLRTEHIDGYVVEAGPDSFLTEKPWAADLCRAVGIGDQLIGSNDAERKTYILVRGRLVVIPDGLMFMVPTKILPTMLSPLFSWKTKARMARELFQWPRVTQSDESVASLVERHYGAEMVDRLADPLLSGIYGGEAAALSVRAVLPRFAEMERTHGSLGRAMLAARKKMSSAPGQPAPPLFTSLKNGMQQLVEAVASRLSPLSLLTNTRVQAVRPEAGGWAVSAGPRSERFDAAILAVPTYAGAEMLRSGSAGISTELVAGFATQLAT